MGEREVSAKWDPPGGLCLQRGGGGGSEGKTRIVGCRQGPAVKKEILRQDERTEEAV